MSLQYTSLYIDRTYYEVWKLLEAITYAYLPLILLVGINFKIWWNLWVSKQSVYIINLLNQVSRQKQEKKTIGILFTVVFVFLVCNLLRFITNVYLAIVPHSPQQLNYCAHKNK